MVIHGIRRCSPPLALLVWVFLVHLADAQPQPDSPPSQPAFLMPPPKELLQRGLQPLPAALPDTKPPSGLLPVDASLVVFDTEATQKADHRDDGWTPIGYGWMASGLRHRPLYFEDAMLERHGQARHPLVQPLASGTRFFLTVPVLPYAMTVNHPRETRHTLGHFRAGSGAPLLLQRPPLQVDAGTIEAATWVGLIFLIP
jgi:hypothetical protein